MTHIEQTLLFSLLILNLMSGSRKRNQIVDTGLME